MIGYLLACSDLSSFFLEENVFIIFFKKMSQKNESFELWLMVFYTSLRSVKKLFTSVYNKLKKKKKNEIFSQYVTVIDTRDSKKGKGWDFQSHRRK